jgi:hypothetical protein
MDIEHQTVATRVFTSVQSARRRFEDARPFDKFLDLPVEP